MRTMIFERKRILLKDGREAILRSPCPEDAEAMLRYLKTTAAETDFVIRYPEECNDTLREETAFLRNILRSALNMMIVCEVDGHLAGNCQIMFHGRMKTRHRAGVAIAITREYWGLGIGTAMFEELIAAAKAHGGITFMELGFIEGNERARHLYEKFGFRIVSETPNAFKLKDGRMLKEFYMQKYL